MEIQQTNLEVYLVKKKREKGKKQEFDQLYKGFLVCHYQLIRKDNNQVVYEFLTDKQSPSTVPKKDMGTLKNNSQSIVWDRSKQTDIVVFNDTIPVLDVDNETILQLTVLEKITKPAK